MKCSLLTLSNFMDSELEARQRGEVEAHLVGCERCARGLTHLREEAERISVLARVHVPDESVRTLMEQVGLISDGGELPMRTNASVTVLPDDSAPWLSGDVGAALPWRTRMGMGVPAPTPASPGEVRPKPQPPEEDPPVPPSMSTWNDSAPPPGPALPWFPPGTTAESLTAAPHVATTPGVSYLELDLDPEPPAPPTEPPPSAHPIPEASTEGVAVPTESPRLPLPVIDEPTDHLGSSGIDVASTQQQWDVPETGHGLPPTKASAGIFAKLKDAIAVRRAVRHLPSDDSVEVVSGVGAPVWQGSSREHVARARDGAANHDRRLQAAAAAAAPASTERVRDELDMVPAVAHDVEEVSLADLRAHAISRDQVQDQYAPPQRAPRVPRPAPAWAAMEARLRERVSASHLNTRAIAIGAGVLLVLILGFATGKSTQPLNAASTATNHTSAVAPPANSNHVTTPAVHSAPSATSSATTQGTPTQLANPQTVGSGGTGLAVGDVRYGNHPGDFRMVFDLTGGTATPTVVIGMRDANTLDIVFTGATPSNATGVLPDTATVTKVTILPQTTSGQTVYEYTLARAVKISKPFFLAGPMRLVVDLG